jgi:hypothetical protein
MIANLHADCGFPQKVDVSATPGQIHEEVILSVWTPMEPVTTGIGSAGGMRIGRVILKPADAVQLIAELSKALNSLNGR